MTIVFASRLDAAARLAERLASYRGRNPLILAIPRGAVPMGRVLADALDGDLDIVLVHKLGAPGNPEFAVGATDETGWDYVADYARGVGADANYLQEEKRAQLERLRERRLAYTPERAAHDPHGRVVIVVDDGLATGATMIAALHAVRAKQPQRLICAVPVASPDRLDGVRAYCDEVVCIDAPTEFHAVGQFYRDFRQVSDEEVMQTLAQSERRSVRAHILDE